MSDRSPVPSRTRRLVDAEIVVALFERAERVGRIDAFRGNVCDRPLVCGRSRDLAVARARDSRPDPAFVMGYGATTPFDPRPDRPEVAETSLDPRPERPEVAKTSLDPRPE